MVYVPSLINRYFNMVINIISKNYKWCNNFIYYNELVLFDGLSIVHFKSLGGQ